MFTHLLLDYQDQYDHHCHNEAHQRNGAEVEVAVACGSPGPRASPGAGHRIGWHLHVWGRGQGPTAACLLQPWLHALYSLPHITPYLSSSDSILPSALFQEGFSPCILDHVIWKKAFTSCLTEELFSGGVKRRVDARVGERFIFHCPGLI